MATTTTTSKVRARNTFDRDTVFFTGVTGDTPGYGQVEVVRITTTERRADGDVQRLLSTESDVEVLATLDADEAQTLIRSLTSCLATSLMVRPPVRS